MHLIRQIRLVLLALVFLAGSLTGCSSGPPKGYVNGKVTFQDQPVTEGLVGFSNPTEGGGVDVNIGKDGSYSVPDGLAPGTYVIIVTPLSEMVDTDPGKSPPTLTEKPAPNIPPRYRNPTTTPLKLTVKEGKNDFDIKMTPK